MVMADYGDRNHWNRQRFPQKLFDGEVDHEASLSPPVQPPQPSIMRAPKILLKPSSSVSSTGVNENVPPLSSESNNVTRDEKSSDMAQKGRGANTDVVRSVASSHMNIPGLLASDGLIHQVQSAIQPPGQHHTVRVASRAIKLIDDTFCFSEAGHELLFDQTDFLVVGVLGMQGVGKSTILSTLAGGKVTDSAKIGVFERTTSYNDALHTTTGIDMFVTSERTIILDSQPVLSASTLDSLIHLEKKGISSSTLEQSMCLDNHIELQSLQIAAFMMTVCNVVVVVMDWFTDATLFKFLLLTEMMKPSTPSSAVSSQQNGIVAPSDEVSEYYPHIMFVLNKATAADFRPENVASMQRSIRQLMCQSKLKYTGIPLTSTLPFGVKKTKDGAVNLFLLPHMKDTVRERDRKTSSGEEDDLPSYRGHGNFLDHARDFTRNLLSAPRRQLTNTTLTEKNWLHYAARVWEVIRKSQLLAEYSRLQS